MAATLNHFTDGRHIRAAVIRANGEVITFRQGRAAPGGTKIFAGDIVVACGMESYPYLCSAAKYVPDTNWVRGFATTEKSGEEVLLEKYPAYLFQNVRFKTDDGSRLAKIVAEW